MRVSFWWPRWRARAARWYRALRNANAKAPAAGPWPGGRRSRGNGLFSKAGYPRKDCGSTHVSKTEKTDGCGGEDREVKPLTFSAAEAATFAEMKAMERKVAEALFAGVGVPAGVLQSVAVTSVGPKTQTLTLADLAALAKQLGAFPGGVVVVGGPVQCPCPRCGWFGRFLARRTRPGQLVADQLGDVRRH